MDEELGLKAERKVVKEIAEEISVSWNFWNNPPENPILLMVGGFQGSGKTTALEILRKDLDLVIISPDEIRHKLFEKGWKVNEQFVHTVNAARNNLLKKALQLGHHIAIDQLTTPLRIDLARKIIEENSSNYRLLTIYLKASRETLLSRASSREVLPGRYRGTVDELDASMKMHREQDLSIYNLVLDSERLNPQQIAERIKRLIVI